MSRYGPPAYVTDRSGELLAAALEQASGTVVNGIERGRASRSQQQTADLENFSRYGWRRGSPPPDPAGPVDGSRAMSDPAMQSLATSLMGNFHPVTPAPAPGASLAEALPEDLETHGSQAPPTNPMLPPPQMAMRGHPGAFDPQTKSFRDGQGMPKILARAQRPDPYVRDVGGGYVDRRETPEAHQEAAQQRGAQLAREMAEQQAAAEAERIRRAYPGMSPERSGVLARPGGAAIDNAVLPDARPVAAVTLKDPNVVNPASGFIEDVYSDGSRKQIRKATAAEIKKATHITEANPATAEKADFQQTQGLQQRYSQNPMVQKAYGVAGAITGLRAALAGDSPMDDLSIIYETVKLFDPNSAVKEGEVKLARSANSLPGQVKLLVDGWRTGRKLTPEMRQQIEQLLERKMAESEASVVPIQAEMGATARRYGVQADSAYIAPSPFQALRKRGAAATDAPAGVTLHSAVSDGDFTRAWNAGIRGGAEIADWVKKNPKKP